MRPAGNNVFLLPLEIYSMGRYFEFSGPLCGQTDLLGIDTFHNVILSMTSYRGVYPRSSAKAQEGSNRTNSIGLHPLLLARRRGGLALNIDITEQKLDKDPQKEQIPD